MMSGFKSRKCATIVVLALAWLGAAVRVQGAGPTFRVVIDPVVRAEPFTGRVYVLLTRQQSEPREGPKWFGTEPFLSLDVTGLRPGEPVELTPGGRGVLTYPRSWDGMEVGGYRAQGVARFNPYERNVGTGEGNGYGPVVVVEADAARTDVHVDQLVRPVEFRETSSVKLLRVRSDLLSRFHGRDVVLQAAVTLPPSYPADRGRRYPTIFEIPGFGGTHHAAHRHPATHESSKGVEFLHVMLDPSCPLGHHVFADSASNGPVNRALREEFIPAFDRDFRSVRTPQARFLTGHSSGGWSSLWIQITAPDEFGGVWSTAPDPVDLADFQRIDIYRAGENMYVDPQGRRRPLARINGRAVLWYDDFAWLEHVNGWGGQLHSFEAVFSPRGADGRPQLLWNRETGTIDPAVAETWKRYDIRLILEQNWPTLGSRLAGKLHIFMGTDDTFYLDGAAARLKESLSRLGSDAVVELHEGKDHSTLLSPELVARIEREMAETWLRNEAGAVDGQ